MLLGLKKLWIGAQLLVATHQIWNLKIREHRSKNRLADKKEGKRWVQYPFGLVWSSLVMTLALSFLGVPFILIVLDWWVYCTFHSISIRTLSSYHLLSALLNWFKLVKGAFGQSNNKHVHNICLMSAQSSPSGSNVNSAAMLNNIARYNLIDTKYCQMAFSNLLEPLVKQMWAVTARGKQPINFVV